MSTKEVIRKLLALLKDYRKTMIVIIGCLLISTALNLCIPLINRKIMDEGFIGGDKKLLIITVLGSFFLYLLCSCIDLLKEKKRIDIAAKDKPVLENINFLIPKGSKTALLGKNGSGKSTVIDLLLRMYMPDQGQILLDGKDISDMPLPEYRNLLSVVSQDIYLFHDTIRNNICLYRQIDDEQIWEACRDSGLMDFIEEVSLDYSVGTNGMMLSGGQKQKIALARALVHDRPIILFDEVTSGSDIASEQQINALLHTRLRDKTVIVIAHRQTKEHFGHVTTKKRI